MELPKSFSNPTLRTGGVVHPYVVENIRRYMQKPVTLSAIKRSLTGG
jgi:ribosomal protein L4